MANPDYRVVEDLLLKGFLTLPSEVAGIPIVFKTVNHREYEMASLYATSSNEEEGARLFASYILAYSVFLFNRVPVLSDRNQYLGEMVDHFMKLPDPVIQKILRRVDRLNSSALKAIREVEAFSYGTRSRQIWHATRTVPLNDPRVTGIEGTGTLGLNMHQQLWMHYNVVEDDTERSDQEWSFVKFAASVHNGKAVKRIDDKDRSKAREEDRRRKTLYYTKGSEDEVFEEAGGQVKVSNESVEDLMTQMKNTIEGQKDFHDLVVEEHENRIRETIARKQAENKEKTRKALEARRDHFEGTDAAKDPFLFYSEEEVQRKAEAARSRKVRALEGGLYQSEKAFQERYRNLQKWGIVPDEGEPLSPVANFEESDSSFRGTLLEDHYRVVEDDLSNPDVIDLPELISSDDDE